MGVFAISSRTSRKKAKATVHTVFLFKGGLMSAIKLSKAVEGFLLSKSASGRSQYTIRNYKKELQRFTEWIGDNSISSITKVQIEKYFQYLRNEFRITHRANTSITPRKLSDKSLKNVWGTLSAFWNLTSKEFNITNPFDVSPIKAHTKPINPLTLDEIEAILKACESCMKNSRDKTEYKSKRPTARRDKAIILTLLDCGLRVSELTGINLGDIDFEMGKIIVTGKGNKQRLVYLGKISRQALWRYTIDRFPNENPSKNEPIFVHHDGIHRLTRQGVLQLFRRLGLKANVQNVHPHRMRHTFAIQFLRNGGNVFELQHFLGHSDLAMVKHYVKLAQLDLESVAQRASPADNWRLK